MKEAITNSFLRLLPNWTNDRSLPGVGSVVQNISELID